MKTKTIKRNIAAAAALIAALALVLLVWGAAGRTTAAHAAAGDVYTQNFASAERVNADFTAYYQLTMGTGSTRTSVGDGENSFTNFYVQGGELIRKSLDGDISSSYTTDSFAILTLTKQQYVNFDLTVEYKMGDATDFWPVVAFRQQEPGKYFLETGAGVFTQKEGKVTLWGSDVDGIGGPYESPVTGYVRDAWHTFRIRMEGLDLTVWLDGDATPALTRKLPASAFKRGYVSLMSINNDTRFRNFRITELPVKAIAQNEPQAPVPSAGTPDSLDNLAERVESIDELHGHTQTDAKPAEQKPAEVQESGCAGSAAAPITAGALCLPAAAVLLFTRRRRKIS